MKMYNMIPQTFSFKELIPNINDFLALVYGYTGTDSADIYHTTLYRWIYQRYANSSIAYNTPEEFFNNFFLTYENHFKQYKKRAEILTKIYGLDDNALLTASQSVQNVALNNNEITKDPLNNIIEYVSEQVTNRNISDIFYKLTAVLNELEDNFIKDFLSKFNKHFTRIFTNTIPIYKE